MDWWRVIEMDSLDLELKTFFFFGLYCCFLFIFVLSSSSSSSHWFCAEWLKWVCLIWRARSCTQAIWDVNVPRIGTHDPDCGTQGELVNLVTMSQTLYVPSFNRPTSHSLSISLFALVISFYPSVIKAKGEWVPMGLVQRQGECLFEAWCPCLNYIIHTFNIKIHIFNYFIK